MSAFKLGRLPRARDPRVPHLSALLAGKPVPAPPAWVDYTAGMPPYLGAMLNDSLGDCTIAALFHARQVWSFHTSPTMETDPDSDVLATYESFCGYSPADPSTDQGGVEQIVLGDWVRQGIPTMGGTDRLAAFVEVDPRNVEDVKRAIDWGGVAYIGISLPQYVLDNLTGSGSTWDAESSSAPIAGGHAIVLAGYDSGGARAISWGNYYRLTWGFLAQYCDEAYLPIDRGWITAKGFTPAGMTLAELTAQADAIREGA